MSPALGRFQRGVVGERVPGQGGAVCGPLEGVASGSSNDGRGDLAEEPGERALPLEAGDAETIEPGGHPGSGDRLAGSSAGEEMISSASTGDQPTEQHGELAGNGDRIGPELERRKSAVVDDLSGEQPTDAGDGLGEQHDEEPGHPIGKIDRLVIEKSAGNRCQVFGRRPGCRAPGRFRDRHPRTTPLGAGEDEEVPSRVRVRGLDEPGVHVGLGELFEGVPSNVGEKGEEANPGVGLVASGVHDRGTKRPGFGPEAEDPQLAPGQVALDLAGGSGVVDGCEAVSRPGLERGV